MGCVTAAALGYAQSAGTDDAPAPARPAWSPPPIERGRYDDITAYNIFSPERAALAAEAQREPDPVEPDPEPIEPVVELPPPDPDALLVLVGVSIHGPVATAHIEDLTSGEVIVLTGPGPFSEGAIESITIDGLTYSVGSEHRAVRIGQALTGESPEAPPADATPSTPAAGETTPAGDTESTPPDDGLSDLERRMRERRNSE